MIYEVSIIAIVVFFNLCWVLRLDSAFGLDEKARSSEGYFCRARAKSLGFVNGNCLRRADYLFCSIISWDLRNDCVLRLRRFSCIRSASWQAGSLRYLSLAETHENDWEKFTFADALDAQI